MTPQNKDELLGKLAAAVDLLIEASKRIGEVQKALFSETVNEPTPAQLDREPNSAPADDEHAEHLVPQEVCASRYRISVGTLSRWRRENRIATYHVGRRILVDDREVAAQMTVTKVE